MTAGTGPSQGANIIGDSTTGTNAAGITNNPTFPNQGGVNPADQGGSTTWTGVPVPGDGPDSSGVPQAALVAGAAAAEMGTELPEQNFAKPTS